MSSFASQISSGTNTLARASCSTLLRMPAVGLILGRERSYLCHPACPKLVDEQLIYLSTQVGGYLPWSSQEYSATP
jgi:hypothetical protein